MKFIYLALVIGVGAVCCGCRVATKPAAEQSVALPSTYHIPAAPPDVPDVRVAQQRVQRHPDSAKFHFDLGIAYYKQHSYAQAISELQQAIKLDPHTITPDAYFYLGYSYNVLHETDKAYQVFMDLVHQPLSKGTLSDAYLALGNVLWDKHQYPQAQQAYLNSLRYNPHQASALLGLGYLAANENRRSQALVYFQSALRNADNSHVAAQAHAALGLLAQQQGKSQEARHEYQTALQLDKDNDRARTGMESLGR